MTVRQLLRVRVALHLQSGCSHEEAMRKALQPLGERVQPQSPAHAVKTVKA